jgi:PAS domain S-box-containing protein
MDTLPRSADASLLRAVLDAIPSMIFVVDENVVVLEANRAAHRVLGGAPEVVLKRLCGDVLHCLHDSSSDTHACGTTENCEDCVLRQSTRDAYDGRQVTRRRYDMRLVENGRERIVHLLVTAAPVSYDGAPLVILHLEDITELEELRRLIPVCAWCGKVRDDDGYRDNLLTWLRKHAGIDVSHALCPDCQSTLNVDA